MTLRQLPNQLTLFRLVLAGLFFFALSQYRYPIGPQWVLWTSIGIFLAAVFTDFLDGFLARRWHVESQFGRIMDPFCDKVLILGAFIYLAGPRFVDPVSLEQPAIGPSGRLPGNMVTGVYPWMVCLILARELLVTGIRGQMEHLGKAFGAGIWGKMKMILQSCCIALVLILIAFLPDSSPAEQESQASIRSLMRLIIDIIVYATLLVTLASGIPYVISAAKFMRQGPSE